MNSNFKNQKMRNLKKTKTPTEETEVCFGRLVGTVNVARCFLYWYQYFILNLPSTAQCSKFICPNGRNARGRLRRTVKNRVKNVLHRSWSPCTPTCSVSERTVIWSVAEAATYTTSVIRGRRKLAGFSCPAYRVQNRRAEVQSGAPGKGRGGHAANASGDGARDRPRGRRHGEPPGTSTHCAFCHLQVSVSDAVTLCVMMRHCV